MLTLRVIGYIANNIFYNTSFVYFRLCNFENNFTIIYFKEFNFVSKEI